MIRGNKRDGIVLLLPQFAKTRQVSFVTPKDAMDCAESCFKRHKNESGFEDFLNKSSKFDLVLEAFDGELPYVYNPELDPFQEMPQPFSIISYIAAGYTYNPINPNLISSWGYSFNYDLV